MFRRNFLTSGLFAPFLSHLGFQEPKVDRFVLKGQTITVLERSGNNIVKFISEDNAGIRYYLNDKLHREDGPAWIHKNKDGTTRSEWYVDGQLHREGQPAIIYTMGDESWHKHGRYHREDGPAVTLNYEDGTYKKFWYLNGKLLKCETKDKTIKYTGDEKFSIVHIMGNEKEWRAKYYRTIFTK
jgi:hypothetical protein